MSRIPLIASAILLAPPVFAQTPPHPDGHAHHPPSASEAAPDDAHHSHAQHTDHIAHESAGAPHAMTGALGDHPVSREGSGTSWIPDSASHGGVHVEAGGWTIMSHATLDLAHTSQKGPRGDDMSFVAGMLMASAQRVLANGDRLRLRAMLSPDPVMGERGYPLLLAAGETADGVEPLIDRQHPHDLFMELSASYWKRLSNTDSVFVYAGLPGEPAFGPPAFMHRPAAVMSPEAPITHHWFDSTHITFGVITAGWVHDGWKLEASRFRGREPDQNRYDIETGPLDSTAIRLSWNPDATWALQASWADIESPELLEPDHDEQRYSVSALYTRRLESGGEISATGAFARKVRSDGVTLDAWLGEAAWSWNEDWTVFTRAEAIETDELGAGHHGPIETASRVGVGVVRNIPVSRHLSIGLGMLANHNMPRGALRALYGGDPAGVTAFVRFNLG